MKKKILIVLEEVIHGIPSGVVSVTDNLLKYIKIDHEVIILANKTHWILKKDSKFKNIVRAKKEKLNFLTYSEFNFLLKKKLPKILVKLILTPIKILIFIRLLIFSYKFIKKKKIDLVINQSGGWPGGELNLALSVSCYLNKIKNILVIHNLSSYRKSFFNQLIHYRDKIYNITATKIITVSHVCRLNLLKNTSLKKINVVKNGCEDFSKLKKIKIKQINKNKFIIGYVGHIHERKGIEIILDAIKNTKSTTQLVIIGGGKKDYIDYLKLISKKNKIDVIFVKLQKKFINFYSNFDLFILPSKKFESFGLVVIEAMSTGQTIICSNFGGMKEIINNKTNGMLFKNEDSLDLRDKINFLQKNKNICKKLSKKAKKDYLKFYTSDIMANEYNKHF